jgi:translation initiation factor IF-3
LKPQPIRKLKKQPNFHGRLFTEQDVASIWLERMSQKMGSLYEYGSQPWKAEDNSYLTLAYLHRSE